MARYVQKISIGGRERWIGWEIDGVGTEVPGLFIVDELPPEELRAKGVKSFAPMSFDEFIGLGAIHRGAEKDLPLADEDLDYRLDALEVKLDRLQARGFVRIPSDVIEQMLGGIALADERIASRIRSWHDEGLAQFVGSDDCFVHLLRRFH